MDIWQGLQRGDTAAIALSCGLFAIAAVILFIVQHVARRLVERRVRGHRVGEASFGELAAMKKQGLLTDEEAKLVRAALARRFAEQQSATQPAPPEPSGDALARLAIEAEQLEQELRARGKAPSPSATGQPAPRPSHEVPLPERLRGLAGKPVLELEELASAGFISEEDLGLLKEHGTP